MTNEQLAELQELTKDALKEFYISKVTGELCVMSTWLLRRSILAIEDRLAALAAEDQIATLERLLVQTAKELRACKDTMRSLNAPPSDAYDSGLGHA
jgi:hypothetical protein